jgi:hypothetical protein
MFGFTRSQAVARAAELRAKPATDADYSRPGEDPAEVRRRFRLLSVTDDYKDYHRLLSIQRMLGDLQRIRHLITDADVSAELAAWSNLVAELDPFPAATGVTTDDESP